jgi:PemK-like protein.
VGKISVTDIVFVAFPFSNLSHTKLRPALILANAQRGDWLLCQITSKSYGDNKSICIDDSAYLFGSLAHISYIRPNKLFTANEEIIVKKVASLNKEAHHKVIAAIQEILTNGE